MSELTSHSCTGCGVLLACNGSHREHEWIWHQRAVAAEARAEAAESRVADLEAERREDRDAAARLSELHTLCGFLEDEGPDWIETATVHIQRYIEAAREAYDRERKTAEAAESALAAAQAENTRLKAEPLTCACVVEAGGRNCRACPACLLRDQLAAAQEALRACIYIRRKDRPGFDPTMLDAEIMDEAPWEYIKRADSAARAALSAPSQAGTPRNWACLDGLVGCAIQGEHHHEHGGPDDKHGQAGTQEKV